MNESIRHVGVNDHKVDLFEGQYVVPNGMSYNSYVIIDEKTAVMDTVDAHFGAEWMENVRSVCADRAPDYLIVQHMEPDHSANIALFMEEYPETVIVSSAAAFKMMKNFFGTDYAGRNMTIKEGDTLELGAHKLQFVAAPMVHWPEVMMTFDVSTGTLFAADAFGVFGAPDRDFDWESEARRYYIGIVGKYGVQVQNLLKKAGTLEIKTIAPLHGPVLEDDLGRYIELYDTWSSYRPEAEGVVVACSSVYGNTMKAAEMIAEAFRNKGTEVVLYDLARCDIAQAVADAFRYDRLVLASPTYNADIFPHMKVFIDHLTERNFQKRKLAFVENGSWAPQAAKIMKQMFEGCKDMEYAETVVRINSAVNDENIDQIEKLVEEM